MFKLKRVYEPPSPDDGARILVDRLWPRGLTKEKAALDLWMKEIAPSTELRKWFDHDPAKCEAHQGTVTLLYAARDEVHNEAVVLKAFLTRAGD
jgi:uncharacterized protein YeaO (DUF488 family)